VLNASLFCYLLLPFQYLFLEIFHILDEIALIELLIQFNHEFTLEDLSRLLEVILYILTPYGEIVIVLMSKQILLSYKLRS
jgi:hypothetical protein